MTDKHDVIPRADTTPARAVMHPLVEQMLKTSPTPEALEKILTLQREWEDNEAKRAYTAALTELKRDLPPWLARDKTVEFASQKGSVRYTHTSLAGAMETVMPHLTNHGFSLTWKPGKDAKGEVVVTAKLTHRLGHSEEATLSSPPDMSGSKSAAQGIASTITLLQRYSALAILGLATADMVEPQGEPGDTSALVNTAKNMKAVAACVRAGKSKDDAEKHLGKPMTAWTGGDLDRLRMWLAPAEGQKSDATTRTDVKITKEDAKALKGVMDRYKMKPDAFAELIEGEIHRKLEGGAMDLFSREYGELLATFAKVESGAYSLTAGKIVRP